MCADVMNDEYVWMIECACCTGFLFEPAQSFGVTETVVGKTFTATSRPN